MADLGIVIVNYASHALIARNLPARVAEQADATVVIVDNYSTDAERTAVRELCGRRNWRLVESANRGFGAGMNAGSRRAMALGCRQLVLINPDAVADAGVLRALGEAVATEPYRLVCPKMVDGRGNRHFDGYHTELATGRNRRGWSSAPNTFNWLTGACLAISAEAFTELGGFDERYFMYWEDVDLSWRARAAGMELQVRDDLVVVHDEGGTQSREERGKSNLYYRYNARNRLLFAALNLDERTRRRWRSQTAGQSGLIWLQGGRRQLLRRPSSVLATIRGAISGLALTRQSRRRAPADQSPRTVMLAHPSPQLYGSDRVLLETASAFVNRGDHVVVTLPEIGPLAVALRERGAVVEICPTPVLRKAALAPAGFVRLIGEALTAAWPGLRLLRRYRPGLMLVNTITIPQWLVLARMSRVKTVCHVHEAERSASALVRRALYAPILLAHRVVINSEFSLGVLADSWPQLRRRATVVYNGVPGPDHKPNPPRARLDRARLLFVGRLSQRKGPHVAIEALAQLNRRGVSARLDLLGAVFEGYEWYEQQLHRRVSQLGLDEQVTFLGFDADIWGHLEAADILLVPSTVDEPFGNTAVEAMLAARPLVVSDTSGLREASAGFRAVRRVTPSEPVAMAEAVAELVASWPEVRTQVLADRADAQRRYDPSTYRAGLCHVAAELVR